jgi:hypothetical protein
MVCPNCQNQLYEHRLYPIRAHCSIVTVVGIEPKYPRFGKTNGHCTAHVVFGHKLHLLDDILDIGIRLHPPLKHKNL